MNTVPQTSPRVAVFGLGSMGGGIARSCVAAGLPCWGFDTDPDRVEQFRADGGSELGDSGDSPSFDAVVIVTVNAEQVESVLFGATGIADRLESGATVICCPTVTPEFARETARRLETRGIHYLDAPISGGAAKAACGELTVMASGTEQAFAGAAPVLEAIATTVFRLGDQVGAGSAMKVVNQLLAGVHIAATAEAMTFGMGMGIEPARMLEVISQCAGSSWMFENRGPHIVDGDYTPLSSVDIFVKDLGIVAGIARENRSYVPLASAAFQGFIAASNSGHAAEDDSAIAKVYARHSGVELPGRKPPDDTPGVD